MANKKSMKTVNDTITYKMNIGLRNLLRILTKSQVNDQVEARIDSQVWVKPRDQVCLQVWAQLKQNKKL
jgi:hypothetical protein